MATNVSIYVPNQGEIGALKAIIKQKAMVLGLYRTAVVPDGNTILSTLTEMTGTGTYVQKALTNDITQAALASAKWFVSTNAQGKAEAAYSNAVQSWAFNGTDVATGYSIYGVFAYCWVLPFDAGAVEIKIGDKIKGVTSSATGIVTGVDVQAGTWGAGTAAGYLDIMTKTGTFQNDENITIFGAINAISMGTTPGTNYAVGDLFSITEAGASGGVGVVLTVNTGAVLTWGIVRPGTGYTVANNKATVKITGSGDDALTVDVDSLLTTKYAATNTGATADATKELLGVWPFAAGVALITDGQTITWDHKLALSTGI